MAGFTSITPNINVNTDSSALRTELLNTFSRLDGQLSLAPYKIYTLTGPVGNVGSAETDIMSTTINQGTMTQLGSSILILAAGKTAANGNNKTLKLVLGSTTLFTSGALALNNVDWTFRGEVVFSGGSSQIVYGEFVRNGGNPVVVTGTASESWATNLTLKFTGTGTASDDISVYYRKDLLLK